MSINSLEYSKVFQTQLDQQVVHEATSGWMEANAGDVKYFGGNEIKIPTIGTTGLGDYDRDDGFPQGSVSFSYQTHKMTQDRSASFQLDRMDVDETNFAANASAVMVEFQRAHVVPEVDAYRYSKLASLAAAASRKTVYTPTADDILKKLLADIAQVKDIVGDNSEIVITMSIPVSNILNSTSGIERKIVISDFKQGEVNLKIGRIDNNPIIVVPSARMKTGYTFYDGRTDGQKQGGFAAAEDAKNINWLLCTRRTPIAVSKTDKMRIFNPDINQRADAWKIDYRKYHDLWVKEKQLNNLWVNISE